MTSEGRFNSPVCHRPLQVESNWCLSSWPPMAQWYHRGPLLAHCGRRWPIAAVHGRMSWIREEDSSRFLGGCCGHVGGEGVGGSARALGGTARLGGAGFLMDGSWILRAGTVLGGWGGASGDRSGLAGGRAPGGSAWHAFPAGTPGGCGLGADDRAEPPTPGWGMPVDGGTGGGPPRPPRRACCRELIPPAPAEAELRRFILAWRRLTSADLMG